MSSMGPEIDPQRYLVTQYMLPKSLTQGAKQSSRSRGSKSSHR